ncbi:MAG: hypothetical protein WBN77_07570 [Desulfobacterales bacterium]
MSDLKVLGIDKNIPSIIFKGLMTLFLLGLATNSLSGIIYALIDIQSGKLISYISLYNLFSILLFIGWVLYLVYKSKLPETTPTVKLGKAPTVHIGLVLLMSKPKHKTPEEIIREIEAACSDNLEELFKIPSIGQLLRGLYKHHEYLKFVWPISTEDSYPFRKCIEVFLKKEFFKKSPCLVDEKEIGNKECKLKECDGVDLIETVKKVVSNIYAEENLNVFGLRKSDVILDMTGGTKTITVGAIFGAIDEGIDIQYVEQMTGKNEIISVSITPEIIFDKTGDYLISFSKEKDKKINYRLL